MIQQWDFPVDEPVSLPEWRRPHLTEHLPAIATRIEHGETLRAIAREYSVSHEALRQALKRQGHATRPTPAADAPPRRVRLYRLPGRGGSMALAPDEIAALRLQHRSGASIRSLARTYGVSHETVRRTLARMTDTDYHGATA
jgi:transposase-like protein